MKVLSTKVLSAQTLELASSMGLELDCVDVIESHAVAFNLNDVKNNWDAVVFTSGNAVRYFLKDEAAKNFLKGKAIYSTSGQTKVDLAAHEFNDVQTADDAAALAAMINVKPDVHSVLHICGNLRLDVMEKKLREAGKLYQSLVVYETKAKDIPGATQGYAAVMFYSPSGVAAFAEINEFDESSIYCCIGPTSATALSDRNMSLYIITAPQPTPEAMLHTIAATLKNKD